MLIHFHSELILEVQMEHMEVLVDKTLEVVHMQQEEEAGMHLVQVGIVGSLEVAGWHQEDRLQFVAVGIH